MIQSVVRAFKILEQSAVAIKTAWGWSISHGRCLLAQVTDNQLENIVNVLGLLDELWNDIKNMESFHKELQNYW